MTLPEGNNAQPFEVILMGHIGAGFTPLADTRINGKRQIRRLKYQRSFDQIIVAPISGDSLVEEGIEDGDFAVLKLNFESSDVRPDRLVVVRCPAGLVIKRFILTDDGLARLISANVKHPDLFYDLDQVKVEALVLRIDRTVYEIS